MKINMNDKTIRRIAMMIPTLNGGGAERVAADLSFYLTQKGYKVIFFLESKSNSGEYRHGGEIVYVNKFSGAGVEENKKLFYSNLLKDIDIYRKLKKEYKIDVTISFMQVSNLLNILSRYEDKVIVTLHSVMSQRVDFRNVIGYGKNIFRYLYQFADKIVLVSQYCQKDWIDHYGDLFSKTIVIQNPVNSVKKSTTDKKYDNLNFGLNTVISVARLDGIKQHWHLIRAFKGVLDKCPDAKLLIAGDGPLKDALNHLCVQLKIEDSVCFLGFVDDIERYLTKCKIMVVTSASESWCNAIAEAMVQGLPIVANDCPGGIRELMGIEERPRYKSTNLYSDCGVITPKLDGAKYSSKDPLTKEEELLANGIFTLLKDDVLRNKMSENCCVNVKKYRLSNIGKKWETAILTKRKKKVTKIMGMFMHSIFVIWSLILYIDINKVNRSETHTDYIDDNEKYVLYYNMLNKWMVLKENGKSIEKFFVDHQYKRIAIYGMADIAQHMICELEKSSVEIVYGIDKRADMIYGRFPILSLDDNLPIVDAVIVTPIFDYKNIEKKVYKKIKCPIISLQEIISYSMK